MEKFLGKIYFHLPNWVHNLFVSGFNIKKYWGRRSGSYKNWRVHYTANENLSIDELNEIQLTKLIDLINYSKKNSKFYGSLYKDIDMASFKSVNDIRNLPILDKESLRTNINDVRTIPKSEAVVNKTGGTTGKSLEVYSSLNDTQERMAIMDNFRSRYGYELGKKTAWFSGKSLISKRDIEKNRFWKTDYWYNVRYYSTYHMNQQFIKYYIKNLIYYKPQYIIGFPSTIYEIARYGIQNNIDFPAGVVKAIFPTAETVTSETREKIEGFFKAKIYDQYASSEGAPFIIECDNGNLHIELQTGVFEVLDSENIETNIGRLIVTSFTTYGTPLIRYDIGDNLELSSRKCDCGNNNPLAERILGRENDFIYSPQIGKINLGNVSNTLKDTHGIIKFQVRQDSLDEIVIKLIIEENVYSKEIEKIFLKNWTERVGNEMKITLDFVSDIPVEKSGKYRMVKNNIKHLLVP